MKFNDVRIYKIQIYGRIEKADIEGSSPLPFAIEQIGEVSTTVTLQTDQSGMIGMIRHLNGLGLTLISLNFTPENPPETCYDPSVIEIKIGKEKS